ncbi:Signal peptidase I [Candidatus Magnetomoraceae bacterium gMMP-15]
MKCYHLYMKKTSIKSLISPALEIWKAKNKRVNFKVSGDSMFPLIKSGNSISVCLTHSDIKQGDIVAYLQNQNVVVHRIIKKKTIDNQLYFCQKGDNLLGWAWISQENLLGRVESIQHGDKTINLLKGHWPFLNKIIGIIESYIITGFDAAQIIKKFIPFDILSGIRSIIIQIVNKFLHIVTKLS